MWGTDKFLHLATKETCVGAQSVSNNSYCRQEVIALCANVLQVLYSITSAVNYSFNIFSTLTTSQTRLQTHTDEQHNTSVNPL